MTADDVAYTWDTNLKYSTNAGNNFKDFVDSVTAVDPQTVLIKSKLDATGAVGQSSDAAVFPGRRVYLPKSLDADLGSTHRPSAAT